MGTLCRERNCKVKRKRYSRKFQRIAVERMRTCESVTELARELGVRPRCLYKWRAKLDLVEPGEESARPSTHEGSYRKQVQQLKRLLGEKVMEVDFLKGALQKVEARRRSGNRSGETASSSRSAK
jgi:transposase